MYALQIRFNENFGTNVGQKSGQKVRLKEKIVYNRVDLGLDYKLSEC